MILDKENLFSEKQAVSATAVSANVVDLGVGDAGAGERPYLSVNASGFTAGTVTVELQTSAAADMSGSKVAATFPVTEADLKKGGEVVKAKLPKGMLRYARLNYAVTGASGTITAGLVFDV